jgi:hypothetical protein
MWKLEPQKGKRKLLLRRFWTLLFGVGMWHWVDNILSFLIIAVIYWLSYELLPRVRVAWRDAAKGRLCRPSSLFWEDGLFALCASWRRQFRIWCRRVFNGSADLAVLLLALCA